MDADRVHLVHLHRRDDDDRGGVADSRRERRPAGGMNTFADASRVLRDAIAARVFPAATAECGASDDVLWQEALGALTFDEASEATNLYTPFDLASLTKVIGTTTAVMQLVHVGLLQLDEPVSSFFGEWCGADRDAVNVRDLLEHTSGLAARLTDPPGEGRREFEHDICTMELEYEPRTSSIYSDLGFILLGFIVTDRGSRSLEEQIRLEGDTPDSRQRAAPTIALDEDRRRGQRLVGDVHDNYAAALGGFAGH